MSTPSDRSRAATAREGQGGGQTARYDAPLPVGGQPSSDRPSGRPRGPESLVGELLGGRYQIERLIGEGGMGAVYQAEHKLMRKRLAVKVLHPEMGRLPEVVARFEREAMAAAHIDHPNVAAATDFGKLDDGSFFLVLEYVEGRSLREVIGEGRLAQGRALHVMRQIATALARAQALGIVHRDLKPENIMLVHRDGDSDFVKVLDFGIAKVPVAELVGDPPPVGQALTQLGMVYGTPEYMAPEQALGQSVDGRADLYALGAMAFEMFTGKRPYDHESKVTLLGMHVIAPIPRMADRAPEACVAPEIEAIVTRLLAKEAAARYAGAKELIEALDALSPSPSAEPSGHVDDARMESTGGASSISSNEIRSSPELAVASETALGPTHVAERTPALPLARLVSLVGASFRSAIETAPRWTKSRWTALLAVALGVLVPSVVIVTRSSRDGPAPVGLVAGGDGWEMAPEPRVRDAKTDAVVSAAQTLIGRGDYATAIEELSAVEKRAPDRADVHMLLERAYSGVRNTHEAMREGALWLAADPNAAADAKLEEDVRNAGLVKDTQDDAFALLESKMGARGVEILYDIAFGTSGRLYPQAASRAKRSLDVEDVRARASTALGVLLDFRNAKSCEDKHSLLERARDQGDARLIAVLGQYESTRGCGFLGRSDCYPCMRRDRLLRDAISTMEDRATRPAAQ
jgi:serine/threonine-protein kinase